MTQVVLVADDDPFNLRLLSELCEALGYEVQAAADGEAVLQAIARERPALLLLDVSMPTLDGFDVMRRLAADPELASIPVVVVTASDDEESRRRAIDLGAEDYVTKPYRVFEIQQRIRAVLRTRAAEERAALALAGAGDTVDPLTHAGTSRQLVISLDYEHTRAARYGHALTCMVVELTNYAEIEARGGAGTGDGVLVQLAAGLRFCVRAIDHVFRSDQAELTLLLPETDAAGAAIVRERIESRGADGSLIGVALEPAPAVRVGVAVFPDDASQDGHALRAFALADARKPPPAPR